MQFAFPNRSSIGTNGSEFGILFYKCDENGVWLPCEILMVIKARHASFDLGYAVRPIVRNKIHMRMKHLFYFISHACILSNEELQSP